MPDHRPPTKPRSRLNKRMNSAFDETYIPPDLDPVDGVSQDFPWAEVFERLDSGEGIVANDPDQFEAVFKLMNLKELLIRN